MNFGEIIVNIVFMFGGFCGERKKNQNKNEIPR